MIDPHTMHMLTAMMAIMPIFILIGALLWILPFWFIFKKAGFSPWLSLLLFLPLVNLVMIYILAFSEWKVVPVTQAAPYIPPRI
ncbi:MAG: hypothetical protein WA891_19755 [Acidobacteriaceae bacterium]